MFQRIQASESLAAAPSPSRKGWLCDAVLLTGFVVAVYFSRLTSMPLRGEETRRAQVAVEMIRSGDWIVPTQQGDPHFMSSRPPLQNWTIALVGSLRGSIDAVAVRLPSVAALLVTMLLIYGYSRIFLSRIGALAAALAYGSMGQVMELCRLGETDAMFAMFVAGSLLVWHAGQMRQWPDWRVWTSAYLLLALATLTKGIQAPVYFAGGVGLYLLVTGRWRRLFTPSHAAGIAVFLAVWGAWQVPFLLRMGLAGVRHVYFGDVVRYVHDRDGWTLARHLVAYPLGVFFGCMAPWSLLLLLFARRDLRRALDRAREPVLFLTCSILAAFPTVWLAPTAKTRFFLSMYPAFAPLVGLVVERCCRAEHDSAWRRFWGIYLTAAAMIMAGAGIGILAVSGLRPSLPIAQPLWLAAVLALGAAGLAITAYWAGNSRTPERRAAGSLALAAFFGLAYAIVVIDGIVRVSNHRTESSVAELKTQLPSGKTLVSLGEADHLFAYYYRDPIPAVAWPQDVEHVPADVEYFCFNHTADDPYWPSFPFEQIATINCDRAEASTERFTIVGRLPRETRVASTPAAGPTNRR